MSFPDGLEYKLVSSKGRFAGVEWLPSSCNLFGAPLMFPRKCQESLQCEPSVTQIQKGRTQSLSTEDTAKNNRLGENMLVTFFFALKTRTII
jgi:hypothetical protein